MKDQGRSDRKRTGGRLKHSSDKKRHQLGRVATPTTLGEPRFKVIDSRGTGQKINALSTNVAQVATDEGETVTVEIEDVVENPANVNYVRRNIITKGAVIETDEGRARVTSRPGQTGQVNAVLVE